MNERVTDEEAAEVDWWMSEHMYRHGISNSINGMGCDPGCRTRAIQTAINRLLSARDAALVAPSPVPDDRDNGRGRR